MKRNGSWKWRGWGEGGRGDELLRDGRFRELGERDENEDVEVVKLGYGGCLTMD